MEVIFLAFSTQYGISSEIRVKATFGPRIKMQTSVRHYKSIGSSAARRELTALLVVGYVAILCSAADLLFRRKHGLRLGFDASHGTSVAVLTFDLFLLIIVPFVFLTFTAYQDFKTDTQGLKIQDEITAVPWASTSVTWQEKIDGFLLGIDTFRERVRDQNTLTTIGLFLSVFLLGRVIIATGAHPRIGVLVCPIIETIIAACAKCDTQSQADEEPNSHRV